MRSQIVVALFKMMLASLDMFVLVEIGVHMIMVDLLNFLIHFMLYLSSWLLAYYLLAVSCEDSLLFCNSWHNG
jgi:hypothetical protein